MLRNVGLDAEPPVEAAEISLRAPPLSAPLSSPAAFGSDAVCVNLKVEGLLLCGREKMTVSTWKCSESGRFASAESPALPWPSEIGVLLATSLF
ncbi:MAG: hypothetical protein ACK56I_22750, partial [bacterium]